MGKRKVQGVVVRAAPAAPKPPPPAPVEAAVAAAVAPAGKKKKGKRRASASGGAAAERCAVSGKRRRGVRGARPASAAGAGPESEEAAEGEAAPSSPAEGAAPPPQLAGRGGEPAAAAVVAPPTGSVPPPSPWASPGARGEGALAWLLWPISPAEFFADYWEKRPLHIRRGRPDYYSGLLSRADIDGPLRSGALRFPYGERLNLSRLAASGSREDLNRAERGVAAKARDVDEAWRAGASMQVLHPQHFHEPVWRLLAGAERAFGATCGANAYLTPSGFQDRAPHFDDVENFMMQLEGSRRWRLHRPPAGEEHPLPRDYSRDFRAAELPPPLAEALLAPGDLLYVPRGVVRDGRAPGGEAADGQRSTFSHHLSISTYHKTAWCDLLERALSGALERAASESAEFRAGLPLGFLDCMGSWRDTGGGANAGAGRAGAVASRESFVRHFRGLVSRLAEFVDLDEVCDEVGVRFTAQRLPPCRSGEPAAGGAEQEAITPDTGVRWVDAKALRAMMATDPEEGVPTVMLFHCHANSREQHMCVDTEAEEDVGCLRFDAATYLPALRALFAADGRFLRCGDLPVADEADRVALCDNLREALLIELGPVG